MSVTCIARTAHAVDAAQRPVNHSWRPMPLKTTYALRAPQGGTRPGSTQAPSG